MSDDNRNYAAEHWAEIQARAKLPKKIVWLNISIEVDVEEGDDDEALMDIIHEEIVEQGFTVDDMGIMNKEATP